VSDHYNQYVNLIRKEVWKRVRLCPGLDFEELMAIGNLTYVEALRSFDETKGCFSTHLYWALRHSLGPGLRKSKNASFFEQAGPPIERADPADLFSTCCFKLALDNLGAEAKEVVTLIFTSAGEFCDFTALSVGVTQKNVRDLLKGWRWSRRKIDNTLGEIKKALRDLQVPAII
jgi:hypothetical protein